MIKCVERIFGILVHPAFNPPVVSEFAICDITFYGKPSFGAPEIGIIEDSDPDLRNRTSVSRISQVACSQIGIGNESGHLFASRHNVETSVFCFGIKLLHNKHG